MYVHASIESLPWESEFFSLATARLNFSASAPLLRTDALDAFSLVQAKVSADQLALIDGLATYGFQLAEGELDLQLVVKGGAEAGQNVSHHFVIQAGEEHIPLLRGVAERVFTLGRFRAPWFDVQDSGRFYATWVEKAVYGTFDHTCLVVKDAEAHPLGFVTLREIGPGEARIGLLAIWPDRIGQGIGHLLMAAAKNWCVERNLHCLRVATQTGNIPALKLYIRHGATIVSSAYWLYRGSKNDSI